MPRFLALAVVFATSCVPAPQPVVVPTTAPAGFSGAGAMRRMQQLMALPRGLGDPGRERSIVALADMLVAVGAPTARHVFEAVDTDGTRFALTNLIADVRPAATHRFVLATHFDTRPWADEEPDPSVHAMPVPGANDGTSGVAVLLELVPLLLRDLPETIGFTVILFDGEELGHGPDMESYCAGSRELARRIDDAAFATLRSATFGIVLDMVGDRDLRLIVEPNSISANPELVEHVWGSARVAGYRQFVDERRDLGVVDDHKFLTMAGIPSILLIDREYPPWHTRADTIDKVSAESLEAVGETLRIALTTLAWPTP